jgi:hypothetical protein
MTKINQILAKWLTGTVSSVAYLKKMGLSDDLIHRYVKSNWIERIGYGAYKKKYDMIEWKGAVYCLQSQLNLSVHPGGKTALELHGLAHYLAFSPNLNLFGKRNEKLPAWFSNKNWKVEINYFPSNLFTIDLLSFFSSYSYMNFAINISCPELAAFELLYHIPQKQSFDEAIKIFDNLTTLRSEFVQKLLENCKSIKVKRLFLYLAENNNHFWLKNINLKDVDLGSGKRVIDINGKLNKKYNITVPKTTAYDEKPIF